MAAGAWTLRATWVAICGWVMLVGGGTASSECCSEDTPSCTACSNGMTLSEYCASQGASGCETLTFAVSSWAEECTEPWVDTSGQPGPAGQSWSSSSDLEMPWDDEFACESIVAVRFDASTLPWDALIASANIQFTATDENTNVDGNVTLDITLEAAVNPEPFNSTRFEDVSGRYPVNGAPVVWQPPLWVANQSSEAQLTPDLAALIQPVVWQADWKADGGGFLVFRFQRHGDGQAATLAGAGGGSSPARSTRRAHSGLEDGDVLGPKLTVVYSVGEVTESSASVLKFAEETVATGVCRLDSGDLELPFANYIGDQLVALETRVLAPPLSRILYAYLQLTPLDSDDDEDVALQVHGEGRPDAATLSDVDYAVSTRTTTDAVVDWQVAAWPTAEPSMRSQSPDLSSIINEVVSYQGWGDYTPLITFILTRSPSTPPNTPRARRAASPRDVPTNVAIRVIRHKYEFLAQGSQQAPPSASPSPSPRPDSDLFLYAMASSAAEEVVFLEDGLDEQLGVYEGDVFVTPADLEMGSDGTRNAGFTGVDDGFDQLVAVRFSGLDAPRGAKVANANIQFTTDDVGLGDVTLRIVGELPSEADGMASELTANRFDLSRRHVTTALAEWAPAPWNTRGERGEAQLTPDLSNIVEEILRQPGWQRGGDLVLLVRRSPNHLYNASGFRLTSFRSAAAGASPELSVQLLADPSSPDQPDVDLPSSKSIDRSCSSFAEKVVAPAYSPFLHGVYTDSSDVEFAWDSTNEVEQMVALYFDNVDVPAHSRILSAYIQFEAKGSQDADLDITIDAHSGVPSVPVAGYQTLETYNFYGDPVPYRTKQQVAWNVDPWVERGDHGEAQRTADLAPLLREIVVQPTWEATRTAMFYFSFAESNTLLSSANARVAHSGKFGGAPSLHVEFDDYGAVNVASGDVQQAEEDFSNGNVFDISTDIELFYDADFFAFQVIGLRFPSLEVPRGAEISYAYIQFTARRESLGELVAEIQVERNATPAEYDASDNFTYSVSSRDYHDEVVTWAPLEWYFSVATTSRQQTPDISSLVQQAIDMPGWAEGNPIAFRLRPPNNGFTTQAVRSAETALARNHSGTPEGIAPVLHVTFIITPSPTPSLYFTPSSSNSPSPTVSPSPSSSAAVTTSQSASSLPSPTPSISVGASASNSASTSTSTSQSASRPPTPSSSGSTAPTTSPSLSMGASPSKTPAPSSSKTPSASASLPPSVTPSASLPASASASLPASASASLPASASAMSSPSASSSSTPPPALPSTTPSDAASSSEAASSNTSVVAGTTAGVAAVVAVLVYVFRKKKSAGGLAAGRAVVYPRPYKTHDDDGEFY